MSIPRPPLPDAVSWSACLHETCTPKAEVSTDIPSDNLVTLMFLWCKFRTQQTGPRFRRVVTSLNIDPEVGCMSHMVMNLVLAAVVASTIVPHPAEGQS